MPSQPDRTNQAQQLSLDAILQALGNYEGMRRVLLQHLDKIIDSGGLSDEQRQSIEDTRSFVMGLRDDPETVAQFDAWSQLETRLQGVLDTGGRTDITQQIIDGANDLSQRSNAILNERGYTPELRAGSDAAQQIITDRGQTPELRELHELGTELVRDRGFTPEFRSAFNRLLDLAEEGPSVLREGGPSTTSAFRPAFDALQRIIESGGEEGAGLLPLGDILDLAESQSARRSNEIAQAAQAENLRRGLSPGPATTGSTAQGEAADQALALEGQTYQSALMGQQQLRAQAVSGALQGLVSLAEAQRNDPVYGFRSNALGDLIRATVGNIATGAQTSLDAQRIAAGRESDAFGALGQFAGIAANREQSAFQNILGSLGALGNAESLEQGNRNAAIQGILGVGEQRSGFIGDLNNQFLQGQGQIAGIAQQGQQNLLGALSLVESTNRTDASLAQAFAGLLGNTSTVHDQRSPLWGILQSIIPGAIGAGAGAFGANIPGGRQGGQSGQSGPGTLSGGGYTPPWLSGRTPGFNPNVGSSGNPFLDNAYGAG